MNPEELSKLTNLIQSGKIVIMPTDTIYGIVGLAKDSEVVERIYQLKDREHTKPFVVLISDYSQLSSLGIAIDSEQKQYLGTVWPGPTSVIMPTREMEHLHRGKRTLAIRMPKDQWLRNLIGQTGPVIATSANIAGKDYVHDLTDIEATFFDHVDYISSSETPATKPSKIIDLASKKILR